MTPSLEQGFAEIAKLPEAEQERFADWILAELAADQRWEESFAATHDALAQLADEALADFRAGKTRPLDPLL